MLEPPSSTMPPHLTITPEPTARTFHEKMAEMAETQEQKRAAQKALLSGLPYVHLVGYAIPAEVLGLIEEETARTLNVIAFDRDPTRIRVAALEPTTDAHRALEETLKEDHRVAVAWHLTDPTSLASALKLYVTVPKPERAGKGVSVSAEDINTFKEQVRDIKQLSTTLERATVTNLVSILIAGALETKSSDIHIEMAEKDIHVRYRIDGVLTDVAALPKDAWQKLIARLKLLSGLKINVSDRPQDGRFSIMLKGPGESKVDVRVSMLPTNFGESVVIRLLGSSLVEAITFAALGLQGRSYEMLKQQLERPNGMVITTGPTGSGKTTTMYAALKMLNEPGVKIITIEDPIEYELSGVNQSQVNPEKNYTFANGLRSIVRQDPDIILVGEIRDLETAEIAIQAALTGHLVLSTVHTNSAAGTVPRLISMGCKPFLLAPALNAMIGQRLVRRLCQQCKKTVELSKEQFQRVQKIFANIAPTSGVTVDIDAITWYNAGGCAQCNDIGYKGRIGIFEIIVMNKDVEKLILSGNVSEYQMEEIAASCGMVTMAQDGLLKASQGITSVAEVFRVVE